jgi:hypothetical protein
VLWIRKYSDPDPWIRNNSREANKLRIRPEPDPSYLDNLVAMDKNALSNRKKIIKYYGTGSVKKELQIQIHEANK